MLRPAPSEGVIMELIVYGMCGAHAICFVHMHVCVGRGKGGGRRWRGKV